MPGACTMAEEVAALSWTGWWSKVTASRWLWSPGRRANTRMCPVSCSVCVSYSGCHRLTRKSETVERIALSRPAF